MPRPPMLNGVSASMVAVPQGDWPDVLAFLVARFPAIPERVWTERLMHGLVLNAQGETLHAQSPCIGGELLYYYRQVPQEPSLPEWETVLFEDEHLLVADKPHFMPVTPAGRYVHSSLLVRLKQQTECDSLTPLHRLDRETAGVVVLCKRPQDRAAYHALFSERQVNKVYEAVSTGMPVVQLPTVRRSRLVADAQFFRSCEVEGAPNSETRISVLRQLPQGALYQLEPHTGQRHQLRIHMMALGLPIAGDQFYPEVLRGPDEAEDYSQALQLLARRIVFNDPVTGELRDWSSRRVLAKAR